MPPVDESAAAVARLLASESYREADKDLGFLQEDQTRGLRLQLEYLKTEMILRRHRVEHSIVVFGSTRTPDGSRYYEIARELGRLVGKAGAERDGAGRTVIMTGGGPGIMEAANRGAHEVGALSVGLNISLPQEQTPNPYVTPELCFRFRYFALRKLHFALRARALVVFPGGFGTLDELFEILALTQTRKMAPVPIILVGEAYWRKAFDADFLVSEGMIDPADRELFWFEDSAEAIWRSIVIWHETRGTPVVACAEPVV
jgi:hypothetical protein